MGSNQEGIAGLAILFTMILIVVAFYQILISGADSQDTVLVWFANRPNLFLVILLVLLVFGAALTAMQSQR
ncbi:hypothetical protein L593_14365 [Salinarchaeum sp. Harcht-Bsk1]|nr:hypothetical protein L593_14365 [Salinarchaeum sp. Harcht-Bsk1]